MGRITSVFILFLLLFMATLNSPGVKAQNHSISEKKTIGRTAADMVWTVEDAGTMNDLNAVNWNSGGVTAVGNGGVMLHRGLGTSSWEAYSSGTSNNLNGVTFTSDTHGNFFGVVVGSNGTMLRTTDGGATWNPSTTGYTGDFQGCAYSSNPGQYTPYAYAVGDDYGLYKSTDYGASWQPTSNQYQGDHLYTVYSYDNANSYVGGAYSMLYRSTDGGSSWNYTQTPIYQNDPPYRGMHFANHSYGWAVGWGGIVSNTTDGGYTWRAQSSNTNYNLNGVWFNDVNNGWAVGDNGTVINTTNGGADWASYHVGTDNNLRGIAGDDQGYVWLVGDDGKVITNYPVSQSTYTLDKSQLNFGTAVNGGVLGDDQIYGQRVNVNTEGTGSVDWSVTTDQDWLVVTPTSGTNTGVFNVTIDPVDITPGTYTGSVIVDCPDAGNSPQTVNVIMNAYHAQQTETPFGSFDTPINGSNAYGSIPVTGWALDDVGVESVKIYNAGSNGDTYLGDAVFIEGARPDVAAMYPDYPNNTRAGWGYTLLTNFLPGGGNGTYTISAIASDREGDTYPLGSKTILCDNESAVKPFGAIDAPVQGGTASGENYRNQGWVLTPMPNKIPTDGSTINVYIDGVNVGSPTYNLYRSDIASLFPGYANSNGAQGFFDFNTTEYENGVHTIQWTVADNAGNTDGVGSRYFSVANTEGTDAFMKKPKIYFGSKLGGSYLSGPKSYFSEINNTNATPYTQILEVENSGQSILNWTAETNADWITLDPETGTAPDWLSVIVDPSGLAAGSYSDYVTIADANESGPPTHIKVTLNVYAETDPPIGEFNYPDVGRTVAGTINFSGWALDDVGVESVIIYRQDGNDMVLLGDANFVRDARPDIAHAYSMYPFNDLSCWNYSFTTNTLTDGEYYFEAEATDFEGNTTILEGNNFTIDNLNTVIPFGSIDSPAEGEATSGGGCTIMGWVLTPMPNTIPTDGSTLSLIIDGANVGTPVYNVERTDITALFPGYSNSLAPGFTFDLNTTDYEDGVHTVSLSVEDDQGNTNENIGSREFVIQNNSNITVDVDDDVIEIPKTTELLNAYPNPFNPTTNIAFNLSTDENVSIVVFDILGRQVAKLLDSEFKSAGSYRVYWNGKMESGHRLSSGIYLVMMKAGNYMQSQKIMLLK